MSVSAAPLPQNTPAARPADAPVEITLRPAGAPVPALKYRLMPERRQQIHGNAAIFYHRACLMLISERGSRMADSLRASGGKSIPFDDPIAKWTNVPVRDLPRDKAHELLGDRYDVILNEVEQGAIRDGCDWEFAGRNDGIWVPLPEMDELRNLARLVSIKARVAILDGKPDEAMHWIETGLTMSRHVAQGPYLILALIGVSIDSLMLDCLLDLVQAPGTPSLYWALADRPRPFIDPSPAYEGERYTLERELPELKILDDHVWSDDEARRFADALQRKVDSFMGSQGPMAAGSEETLGSFERRFRIATMAARLYPQASRALIEQGWPDAKVRAMPVLQVACLYSYSEYGKLRDEMYKWLNVPYRDSFDELTKAMERLVNGSSENPILGFFGELTPSLNTARMSLVRLERQFDALQAIEAIRLYAHSHQGTLPPNLEAITEAPVPIDLATGKPFEYKVSGETATLSGPNLPGALDHPRFRIDYRLKLAR
ncbi:hypothetical protein GC170_16350 [bacterium]|nr:hypothetical protein [bacterium]